MSVKNNLKVLTNINLKNDLLEYSEDSFHKAGSLKKIIYIVKNIFYSITFSNNNAFKNCELWGVAGKIYEFLDINKNTLTKEQFSIIKKHFDILHNKAIEKKKDCVGDLNFMKSLIEKPEKSKNNKSNHFNSRQSLNPLNWLRTNKSFTKESEEPDFVGINNLIIQQKNQLNKFKTWENNKQWSNLHKNHFDWWMFPINQRSQGQGGKYTVNNDHVKSLLQNSTFISDYRKGVEILLKSWGWNTKNHKMFFSLHKGQGWNAHTTRLAKVLQSLKLFNQKDLLKEVQNFAKTLIKDKKLKPNSWIKSLL